MRNEHKAVEEVIDSPLSEVANLIKVLQSCQGKVVFIGVGKSGIIARKLAATFASTGTPSFFVHGTEAVHGDLGMVAKDDVVILISNSGETAEMCIRDRVYTAVTRARRRLSLYADERILSAAIATRTERRSGLAALFSSRE